MVTHMILIAPVSFCFRRLIRADRLRVPRMPCHWLAMCGLLLILAAVAPAAMLPGAELKEFPANPEKHVVQIQRKAATEADRKMIAAAEAAVPDKEALQKALGDKPMARDEVQWWHQEQLGVRIPFAVTGAAVEYFRKLVEGYQKQAFKRYSEPTSKLDYEAGVAFHKSFEHEGRTFKDVHVVTLKLSFSEHFAATVTEGMDFEKHRIVILDAKGAVLAIYGDGPTEVPVLAV